MMDRCRAHSPGTDYSLQASLMVMVTGVAATIGGLFTDRFGYGAVFATAAMLTLLALVPAFLFFRDSGFRRTAHLRGTAGHCPPHGGLGHVPNLNVAWGSVQT